MSQDVAVQYFNTLTGVTLLHRLKEVVKIANDGFERSLSVGGLSPEKNGLPAQQPKVIGEHVVSRRFLQK
jgi:hypothetical protein